MKKISNYIFLIILVTINLNAQDFPDSLLYKVGFFKFISDKRNILQDTVNLKYFENDFPIATHFFVKPNKSSKLFLVTARHVILFDSTKSKTLRLVRNTRNGKREMVYGAKEKGILIPQDSLVDLVLLDLSFLEKQSKMVGDFHWFNTSSILTKEEFYSLKENQEVYFLGLFPDSTFSEKLWYWHPKGNINKILDTPITLIDTLKNFKLKSELLADIISKPGVSGSPILLKRNNEWKIVGVINGINNKLTFCTPAYKILEIINGIPKN